MPTPIGDNPMTMTTHSGERTAKLMGDFSSVFLRLALGLSFLSALGDRFGFWGAFGQSHVAWGDFSHFVAYAAKLNWFMPSATIPALAWASTCAEILLGVALVLGVITRVAAFLSGLLLLLFALVMTSALGLEAPLSLSVFLPLPERSCWHRAANILGALIRSCLNEFMEQGNESRKSPQIWPAGRARN